MNPGEVARRFDCRDGFYLIDYAPVALPLYRLTVDAVTKSRHEIPPVREFVMQSLAVGLRRASEVAGFLGLNLEIVEDELLRLYAQGYIDSMTDRSGFLLLESGRAVLANSIESTPRDEILVFLYDRILNRPIRINRFLAI